MKQLLEYRKKLGVPSDARRKMILPDMRQKVFKEIIETYQRLYGIKLIYAFLNTDPESIVDYAAVFTARNDDDTADLVLYLAPPIYTELSTPGYRYCRVNKMASKWYQFGFEHMVKLTKENFYGFLQHSLFLSIHKGDDLYWKDPRNYYEVIEGLIDLSHLYNRKDRPIPQN